MYEYSASSVPLSEMSSVWVSAIQIKLDWRLHQPTIMLLVPLPWSCAAATWSYTRIQFCYNCQADVFIWNKLKKNYLDEAQNAFLYRSNPQLNQLVKPSGRCNVFGHLSVNCVPWQHPFQKHWTIFCLWNIWTFYLFHKSLTKNIYTSSINPRPHSFLTLSWLDSLGGFRGVFS